ncbi:indole-3-glycerol phosphate synthase TrpC [Candidatus Leptofilum sp.]|uniref:indole-3-glycerol phosphate synthase TrpC n=1 Tax=Candidatus Leptofilum sp. TaxID=3241576 RepID=UPI003B5B07D1
MSVTKLAQRRGTILDEIMTFHRENLPKIMREVPLADLRALASVAPPTLDFYAALKKPGVSLIAECKKASPSKGLMVPHYNAADLAKTYAKAGAGAISVLTDGRHFQGSLADMRDVKETVSSLKPPIPVLRKDFIFHPYQVYEARVAGADALLLITAVLSDTDLKELLALTHRLGMNALIEVHTEEEVARVLPLQPRIVGVNNRNLQTFEVDFENTARLRQQIPAEVVAVGESGLKTAVDVQKMAQIGVDAILVGETLVKSKNVSKKVAEFVRAGRPFTR